MRLLLKVQKKMRGFVYSSCILICLLMPISGDFADDKDNMLNAAQSKFQEVVHEAKKLTHLSRGVPMMTSDESNFDKALTRIGNMKNRLRETFAKTEDMAERVAGAVPGFADGCLGLVNGFKDGDWLQGVQGALSIVSSMAALAGPVSLVASSLLSVVSSILGIIGGSEQESAESMTKRIIEGAIAELRNKDLKEDVEGVQHFYQSLSSSINHFRESKKLTASQAEEFYTLVFSGLPVFGKLKARIGELCANTDKMEKAKTCVDFVKFYCDLSIMRQLIIADIASLMTEPEIKLENTANNFLNVLKREQVADCKLLEFLTDVENYPKRRMATAVLFGNPEKYTVVLSYFLTFEKNVRNGIYYSDIMVACSDKMLGGDCISVSLGEINNLNIGGEENKFTSVFIPLSLSLVYSNDKDFGGTTYGPLYGPAVYGYLPGRSTISSTRLEETNIKLGDLVRFCEGENLNPETLCDSFTMPEGGGIIKLNKYHGLNWETFLNSLYIPAGKMVMGYSGENGDGKEYGPFYGPQTVNKVCYADENSKWKSVGIYNTDKDARSLVQFCEKTNLGGACFRTDEYEYSLDVVHGNCNFDEKIASIKIPSGLVVVGYSKVNNEGSYSGFYNGPVTIEKVDNAGKWRSFHVFRKKEEQTSDSQLSKYVKRKHSSPKFFQ